MRYFRNPRQGMMLTAIAGPGANFILAILFATVIHILIAIEFESGGMVEMIIVPLYLISQAPQFLSMIQSGCLIRWK